MSFIFHFSPYYFERYSYFCTIHCNLHANFNSNRKRTNKILRGQNAIFGDFGFRNNTRNRFHNSRKTFSKICRPALLKVPYQSFSWVGLFSRYFIWNIVLTFRCCWIWSATLSQMWSEMLSMIHKLVHKQNRAKINSL